MANERCKKCYSSLVLDEEELCAYCELHLGENAGDAPSAEKASSVDCGVCKVIVKEDSEGLFCDVCDTWFHNDCNKTPLHSDFYAMLNEAPQNIKWFCDNCIWETEEWITQRNDKSKKTAVSGKFNKSVVDASNETLKEYSFRKISNDSRNKKELVVKVERLDMTLVNTQQMKFTSDSKSSAKEKLEHDEDNLKNDNIYESDKNEIAEMIISSEEEFYNDTKEFIFNEKNYADCPFEECNLVIFVEHAKKHLQTHENGISGGICDKKLSTRNFLCGECGQTFQSFDNISNHIFTHFKETIPSERVCICGYKSKQLSSFKFHKCDDVNVQEMNTLGSTKPEKGQSSNNHNKLASYQKYNPSECSDISDDQEYNPPENCDISDDSDDSDYIYPLHVKSENRKRFKRDPEIYEKDDLKSKKNDIEDSFNNIETMIRIICKRCDITFDNKHLYMSHLNECRKTFPELNDPSKYKMEYYCNQCDFVSGRNKKKLLRHIKKLHANKKESTPQAIVHHSDKLAKFKVSCTKCNNEFDNDRMFHDHLKKNEKNCDEKQKLIIEEVNELGVKFTCIKCNDTFRNRNTISQHIVRKHSIIRYHCNQCDFKSNWKALQRHIKTAHDKNKVCCPICGQIYGNQVRLSDHMRNMHPGDPDKTKSICNICGKLIKTSKLKEHMLIHRVDKPFPCKLCKFSATKKYNLDVHMKSHNKEGSNVFKRTLEKRDNITEKPRNTCNMSSNITPQPLYFNHNNKPEKDNMEYENIDVFPRNTYDIHPNVTRLFSSSI